MLILTRKTDQAIIIGDQIVVQVLDSHNGQTRLGITAPRDVSIHREEIFERIYGYSPRVLTDLDEEGNAA